MDADEFDAGMAVLLANWHKEVPPDATLIVYEAVLAHLPGDLWKLAIARTVAEATFFPRPAELLTAMVRAMMARDGHSEAWARMVLMENVDATLLFPAGREMPQVEAPEMAKERGL